MADNTSVQVALRIRPLIQNEISKGFENILEVYTELNQVKIKNSEKAFSFNHIFDTNIGQDEFYNKCVQNMIENLFKGYNVTILAYGQTGSGKTYSMGTVYSEDNSKGVIPRALHDIFSYIKDNFSYDFAVTVSFLELYQEVLYDLLSDKPREQCVVDIREDAKAIFIPGLTEQAVTTSTQALEYLVKGSHRRATSSTNMNAQSSRSHAIFTINISMQKKDDSNINRTAKFHLVDLAGSERSKKTGATGQTFKEGVNINKGLLALGNVISALGDEKSQHGYISYRDSNLTRLLKDSLGGNSITLMIACVSPADYNMEETMSTLRYADRARKIKNKPVVNQDPKTAEINRLKKLNQQLRLELIGQGGPIICQAELELLKKEANDLKHKNHMLNTKLSTSLNDITVLFERIHLLQSRNEELIKKLNDIKDEYNTTLNNLNASIEKSDVTAIKENVTKLASLQEHLSNINSEHIQTIKELRQHEADNYRSSGGEDSDHETEINEKQETHTAQQIALSSELQEIMRKLAVKERLAEYMSANAYTVDYNEITECEKKIVSLEHEKQELLQQLKNIQSTGISVKIAEQRRKRVHDLEGQIHDLNKKVSEQAKMIKIKESNEQKMKQLHNEIISMKKTKVDLMKKMKAESDKFRNWKNQREKELLKLKDQDRKRLNQINKMETMHVRQQNVLKRKVEEAVALNKRLKDTLAKRKAVLDLKSSGNNVSEWVNHELELHVNVTEAQLALKSLLEDRALLYKQLDSLKTDPGMLESFEVKQLEDDIALRSTQIQDLQQKIMDSDAENRAQVRFDNIHTMSVAKQALKTLFDSVVTIKENNLANENNVHNLENKISEMKRKEQTYINMIKEKEIEWLNNQREYEEKVTVLLGRRVEAKDHDENIQQLLSIQQDKINKIEEEKHCLELEITTLKLENQNIVKQNTITQKNMKKKTSKKEESSNQIIVSKYVSDEDVSSHDDDETDPDWRKTPLAKRCQKIREPSIRQDLLKRSSEGGCTCKGTCSTRNCGCKRFSKTCGNNCKCGERCANKDISADKENDSAQMASKESSHSDEFLHRKPRQTRKKLLPLEL